MDLFRRRSAPGKMPPVGNQLQTTDTENVKPGGKQPAQVAKDGAPGPSRQFTGDNLAVPNANPKQAEEPRPKKDWKRPLSFRRKTAPDSPKVNPEGGIYIPPYRPPNEELISNRDGSEQRGKLYAEGINQAIQQAEAETDTQDVHPHMEELQRAREQEEIRKAGAIDIHPYQLELLKARDQAHRMQGGPIDSEPYVGPTYTEEMSRARQRMINRQIGVDDPHTGVLKRAQMKEHIMQGGRAMMHGGQPIIQAGPKVQGRENVPPCRPPPSYTVTDITEKVSGAGGSKRYQEKMRRRLTGSLFESVRGRVSWRAHWRRRERQTDDLPSVEGRVPLPGPPLTAAELAAINSSPDLLNGGYGRILALYDREPHMGHGYTASAPSLSLVPEKQAAPFNASPGFKLQEHTNANQVDARYDSVVDLRNDDFIYRHGRAYHGYKYRKLYYLPCDGEQQSIELELHKFLTDQIQGGKLHLAPLPNDPVWEPRILELGTGTGKWALEMGEKYIYADIYAIDLTTRHREDVEKQYEHRNVKFMLHDIDDKWDFPDDYFDFIYARNLAGGVFDLYEMIDKVYKHLKPGGYFEFLDPSWEIMSDGRFPRRGPLITWNETFLYYMRLRGIPVDIAGDHWRLMQNAGFHIKSKVRWDLPIGCWELGCEKMGKDNRRIMRAQIPGMSLRPWIEFAQCSDLDCDKISRLATLDLHHPKSRYSTTWYHAVGQKPLAIVKSNIDATRLRRYLRRKCGSTRDLSKTASGTTLDIPDPVEMAKNGLRVLRTGKNRSVNALQSMLSPC